jgi:DNA-binding XRE family transcriptional regulator
MTGKEYAVMRDDVLDLTQVELAAAVGVSPSTIAAREQQPDKDVSSEAEMAIISIAGDRRRQYEGEAAAGSE